MTKFGYKDGLWCCKTTNSRCTKEFDGKNLYGYYGKCIGNAIPLTQQCHDNDEHTPLCNYYPTDRNRYQSIRQGHPGHPGVSNHHLPNDEVQRSFVDICNDNR
jgi:hypothetical protein